MQEEKLFGSLPPHFTHNILQVCIRAIYSSSEEVFEAELSPVYGGMCFGNGSIHTTLCVCNFVAAAGNQAVKMATSGRK